MGAWGRSIFAGASDSVTNSICAECGEWINGVAYLVDDETGKQLRVHSGNCDEAVRLRRRAAQPVGVLVNFPQEQVNGADVRVVKKFKNGRLRVEFVANRRPFYALQQITIPKTQFQTKEEPNA